MRYTIILLLMFRGVIVCSAPALSFAPSGPEIGDILGYPAEEIVVTDITEDEKQLWTVPTIVEGRDGTPLTSPDNLLAAYKIVSKKPATFFPILMWIVKEGTFLNDQVRQTLEQISLQPDIPVVEGGRGPFGTSSFGGVGDGGIYPAKVRVASTTKEMTASSKDIAFVADVDLASRDVDVRMALMSLSSGASSVEPLLQGEAYYEMFGPQDEETLGANDGASKTTPRKFDELFGKIFSLVDASLTSDSLASPTPPSSLNGMRGPESISSTQPLDQKGSSSPWPWILLGAIAISVLVYATVRNREKGP